MIDYIVMGFYGFKGVYGLEVCGSDGDGGDGFKVFDFGGLYDEEGCV